MSIDKPRYLTRVEVIIPVNGDEMVWMIGTCTGLSKYVKKYRKSVQTCKNRLEMTAWSACVRADLSLWW